MEVRWSIQLWKMEVRWSIQFIVKGGEAVCKGVQRGQVIECEAVIHEWR
jgi:hypothetical protein